MLTGALSRSVASPAANCISEGVSLSGDRVRARFSVVVARGVRISHRARHNRPPWRGYVESVVHSEAYSTHPHNQTPSLAGATTSTRLTPGHAVRPRSPGRSGCPDAAGDADGAGRFACIARRGPSARRNEPANCVIPSAVSITLRICREIHRCYDAAVSTPNSLAREGHGSGGTTRWGESPDAWRSATLSARARQLTP